MKAVTAEAVTVGYQPGIPVLRGITLGVAPGELVAVTGPSGAGKTTLLRTLAGVLTPTAGTVRVGGVPIADRDQAVAARVVLVPQERGLATILTAGENLLVALLAAGLAPEPARQRAAQALARLGLTNQADQLVEELSGGQQQRTAIARGLALPGAVLLADEVTSELDAANRQLVLELLRSEADRGAAVVFATHDLEAAAASCDRELRLRDGRLAVAS